MSDRRTYTAHFQGRTATGPRLEGVIRGARIRKDSVNFTLCRKEGRTLIAVDRGGNVKVPR